LKYFPSVSREALPVLRDSRKIKLAFGKKVKDPCIEILGPEGAHEIILAPD